MPQALLVALLAWLPALAPATTLADGEAFPLDVRTTDLVRGPEDSPSAVLDVTLTRALLEPARILVVDATGGVVSETIPSGNEPGARLLLPVPMPGPGTEGELVLRVAEGAGSTELALTYPRPEPGWVLHFVPGFHYDPVWWNTQAHYTETGDHMDAHVGPGLDLVDEHVALVERDADYRVALHQLPYLKTHLEAHPHETEALRAAIASGRVGLVGGTYNELSTTLISAEATARNAIHGRLFQRDILDGAADTFWQCDVFGHDPSFPSLMSRAGLTTGGFGRGPFHQWGADRDQVNIPSEFLWMGPDGRSVLTHYMTGHYGYAYSRFASGSNRAPEDPERQQLLVADMFADLKRPALTHHVLLPMHMDFIRPLENIGDVVRAWNATYLSPRATIDTSEAFFADVAAEIEERDLVVPTITRDMNPIYTGCPVSFADLKTANREAETVLRDAEIFATIAALSGAAYPSVALDRAWRQLLFNAHHDGITGSMSDQVYLDIMAGYRDALELATEVRDRSLTFLERNIDTWNGDAAAVVWNSTAHPRNGRVTLPGDSVRPLTLRADDVPPVGYRALTPDDVLAAPGRPADDRADAAGDDERRSRPEPVAVPQVVGATVVLVNPALRVVIDLARGGALTSVLHRPSGRELLAGPGNDVVLHDEYAVLPGHGEGPWHLSPTGTRRPGTAVQARVLPPDPAHPARVSIETAHPEYRLRRHLELDPVEPWLLCTTEVLGWSGSDALLRVEFPLELPGARPVFQTAAAVVGRPFARDVDTARDSWTLDNTCWQWAGLGAACPLEIVDEEIRVTARRALGVGEIVLGRGADDATRRAANTIAEAFVHAGVTTTITSEGDRRYGDLTWDSNVPDVRILLGTPDDHDLLADVLARHDLTFGSRAWIEEADALPVLVVPSSANSVDALVSGLERYSLVRVPAGRAALMWDRPDVDELAVALVNRGPVSVHATADGVLGINLMRSCTSWPSGTWIDAPDRRLPDGAPMGTMHGSHVFEYALVVGEGGWRAAELNRTAQRINQPLLARAVPQHDGTLPAAASFLSISEPAVQLAALKPAGFGAATWSHDPIDDRRVSRVVARLWNGSGRERETGLHLAFPVRAAWRADLLEQPGAELSVDARGDVTVTLGPWAYETVLLDVTGAPDDGSHPLDPTHADVSPSAYWLENLGEGVTGNGVRSIVPEQRQVVLDDRGRATVDLLLANQHQESRTTFELDVTAPEGLSVELQPARVAVEPGAYARTTMSIVAPPGALPGLGAITLTDRGADGSRSVTGTVWVARDAATLEGPAFTVEVGTSIITAFSELQATIVNHTDGPIDAVATWLSPGVLWPTLPEWRQAIHLPARGTVPVSAIVGDAPDSFALLKVAAGGRLAYGESIAVTSDPRQMLLSFAVDRARFRARTPARVYARARSLDGLTSGVDVRVQAPDGWSARAVEQELSSGAGGVQELSLQLEVVPGDEGTRGDLVLAVMGPAGTTAVSVPCTVAPVQPARPTAAGVVIDGDLSEWDADEFTEAAGELGRVRAAVRYDTGGLVLAFDVVDETFRQSNTGATIWEGDSVQVAFSISPATALGYGDHDIELGAALTPKGPRVWSWYAGESGATGLVPDAEIAVNHADGATHYELRLPRSALPRLSLEPGSTLGFSYIANDDDGQGYRGATQWTGGMVGGKDSSLFGELVLEEGS